MYTHREESLGSTQSPALLRLDNVRCVVYITQYHGDAGKNVAPLSSSLPPGSKGVSFKELLTFKKLGHAR